MLDNQHDASTKVAWPPIIFATAFALAILASWQIPIRIANDREPLRWIGISIMVIGAGIALIAEASFLKAGTATLPTRSTRIIVHNGIYRFTRNPMYLGFCLLLTGAGLLANSWWFLLILPIAVFAVTKLAIEREEAYLEKKFGPSYLNYKARTRRWL